MLTGSNMSDGVLPDRELRLAVRDGWIVSPTPIEDQQFQPASLDLRLGADAYQLRASFLPFRETVQSRLGERGLTESDLVIDQLSLTGSGATLQRGSVYLVPLLESLDLPSDMRGRSNPKSTTRRLAQPAQAARRRDVDVRRGARGPLSGAPAAVRRRRASDSAGPGRGQRWLVHGRRSLGAADGRDHRLPRAPPPAGRRSEPDRLLRSRRVLEPIKRPARDSYILEANRFYILLSKERIRVPPEFAAEMVVYDAGAGEIRTHYAGFFDPGFGWGDGSILGTKVVMEVRAREVPFMVYDGQTSFKVWFERLRSRPERVYGSDLGSSYQRQTLTLSKHFKRL